MAWIPAHSQMPRAARATYSKSKMFMSRRSTKYISLHLQHQKSSKITSDMWHVHVRSIIAVPSMWLFEPGKHRTQDCSLSSPFSFLRSPAVVSPRPKT
ncbi:hypothetical protein LI328DRAFT_124919 [Trichoderma asperelloides]|nr:hypothetical protein LI328DRAFT_124919 [Trichoderma asperelloides]